MKKIWAIIGALIAGGATVAIASSLPQVAHAGMSIN